LLRFEEEKKVGFRLFRIEAKKKNMKRKLARNKLNEAKNRSEMKENRKIA
jgi:hypothetical protein